MRLDRSNPHGGERALVVRNLGEGSRAGAFTSVTLTPGTYSVSYWACADAGETAKVGATVAGKELAAQTVGEEWTHIVGTLTVTDTQKRTAVRLYSLAPRVSVWFDDVRIERTR